MQNFRNYYQILAVTPDTSIEEVKRVYRRLARQYHPDLNPGDKQAEERFKDILEAYEILSDPTRREEYDRLSFFLQQRQKNNRKWNNGSRFSSKDMEYFDRFPTFDSFLDSLLNRRREMNTGEPTGARSRPVERTSQAYTPGRSKVYNTVKNQPQAAKRDIEALLTLPLEKAYHGGKEKIRLEDGRSLEVDMPPGMVTGEKMRLRKLGMNGGDLYLKVTVAPHPFLDVQGNEIYCKLPITPVEAILGGQVEVLTLDGLVKMNLPKEVYTGKQLRLAKKGYVDNRGRRGDQVVEIEIRYPEELTAEQRGLYEKLRDLESGLREILWDSESKPD
ncbi:DnaJ C-terminal domain-containing protein [Roseofilum casamattae]|uniref:DnaJ C-terminal domain-containing protein n=1 Tax=Roseofilum casamattae BLCC-M143 TaxID=3022442 RepID=A0ABT7BSC8_9CYAN|nr:DnaJ C-terminal domain-containing protein [Roseofilum casamattae]MDJ1182098.1 DnaJ C-terminal domain-containing protein [Roseofilum casamattae BLCC-M143]